MSKEGKESDNFHLDKGSVSCNLCRCGRKAFHKETRTTTDKEGNTVVNQIEERSSWRLGTGRGTTPDDQSIFRTNKDAKEDTDTVDTGWGKVGTGRSITPEEAEERKTKLEHELEELKNKNKTIVWMNINILVYGLFIP